MNMAETRHIVSMMEAIGRAQREEGVIAQWKKLVEEWALHQPGNADAEAVKSWLPQWQARPFYTAEELAPIWPALAIATGFTNTWPAVVKSARRLEHELDFCGMPRLRCRPEYFIVERWPYWRRASETEIMRELQNVFCG